MAVEVRDVALEHYSASAVLVRFPSGEKVWLPLSQIEQMPKSWCISASMSQSRGKYLIITDQIAKQKGFKITPRELDIDPELSTEKPAAPAQTENSELSVSLEAQIKGLERDLKSFRAQNQNLQRNLDQSRAQVAQVQVEYARVHTELSNAEAQRDKALADLALAQDALRKATERADKAEAYVAAQGRSHRPEAQSERFALLELE